MEKTSISIERKTNKGGITITEPFNHIKSQVQATEHHTQGFVALRKHRDLFERHIWQKVQRKAIFYTTIIRFYRHCFISWV